MGKIIVEQIVSLDGYAEDARGSIDFFDAEVSRINEADADQLRMVSGIAAIVLGRRTYQLFADYWPSADPVAEPIAIPLNERPKYVVSSTLVSAPWGRHAPAEILRGDGVAAMRGLRERLAGDLIIWGSLTLTDALLRAGAVDVLRLRIVPVLLGRGRSFAPPDLGPRRLSLATARSFAGGLVVLEYGPAR